MTKYISCIAEKQKEAIENTSHRPAVHSKLGTRATLRQSQQDSIATNSRGTAKNAHRCSCRDSRRVQNSKLHGLRVIRAEMRQRTSRSDAKWVTMQSSLGSLDNLQGCEIATNSPVTFSSHVHMPGQMELLMSLWVLRTNLSLDSSSIEQEPREPV
jgi:hypothetical protein